MGHRIRKSCERRGVIQDREILRGSWGHWPVATMCPSNWERAEVLPRITREWIRPGRNIHKEMVTSDPGRFKSPKIGTGAAYRRSTGGSIGRTVRRFSITEWQRAR